MKINNKKIVAMAEIMLMVVATISFSYILREGYENQTENSNNLFINLYSKIVKFVIGERGLVSATEAVSTCLRSKDGKICQEYTSSDCATLCEIGKCVPAMRSDVAQCRIGTCMDSTEGTCQPMSPKESCESNNGIWYSDQFGNNAECKKACCTWGSGSYSAFVTERTCQRKQNITGSTVSFNKNIKDEISCLNLARNQEKSACIFAKDEQKTCKFTTRGDCLAIKGNFTTFGGRQVLCTNQALGVSCQKTTKTACVAGKDEIYFTDSCGNTANIYDANRKDDQTYWDYVVDKASSCGAGTGNMNSLSCGNCNYLLGSICKSKESNSVRYGDYICHDLNCKDDLGNTVKNGESWCLYDGTIGDGKDVPGSRHFKRVCRDGVVTTDPCADFRNEICMQGTKTIEGVTYKEATCRINRWQDCLNVGSDGSSNDCTQYPECFVKNVNIADEFKFQVCLPHYPEGFDLQSGYSAAKSICSSATATCNVLYKKKLTGWTCIQNCECEEKGFTEQMNSFCTSLGDCGAEVNIYKEAGPLAYSVKGRKGAKTPGKVYASDYADYATYKPGQQAVQYYGTTGDDNQQFAQDAMSSISDTNDVDSTQTNMWSTGATIGMAVGAVAVGVGASIAGAAPTSALIAFLPLAAPLMIVGVVILIAAIVIMVMGIGKVEVRYVDFKCYPWQPPLGGAKCGDCMKDPKRPCSQYRCQSIGGTCQFINEGTSQEDCIDVNPKDASSPYITPLWGVLTANYSYTNISERGFKISSMEPDGCLVSASTFSFGINASEPAQCKWSVNKTDSYDEMDDYFGDNLFLRNHTIKDQYVPSLTSLGFPEYDTRARMDFSFYLVCQDTSGNKNVQDYSVSFCIKPGRDITGPVVMGREPDHDYVKYDATERNLSIFTSEPATCRWNFNESGYDEMNRSFSCWNNITQQELNGWRCKTGLPMPLGVNETKFYVRCKDQPWDENINETNRNANAESYTFTLRRTAMLKIDSLLPNETVWAGSEPVTVNLRAVTSGGADSLVKCQYQIGGQFINFFNTYRTIHEQVFGSFMGGNKEINVSCSDIVNNTAYATTRFNISIDKIPPLITRVYNSHGSLMAITNEPGTCNFVKGSFVDYKCNFINSSVMSGTDLLHSTALDTSSTYYIKCADRFGNQVNDSCSAVVRGGAI